MAITTVAITGPVVHPDGTGVLGGTITARLSVPASALDGATSVHVGGGTADQSWTIGAGGAVSMALAPNDTLTPSGTYYLVTIAAKLANGKQKAWTLKWQVPSGPALDIGAVPRLEVVPGVALGTAVVIQDGSAHRAAPATLNHVVQSWEVATAAARLALVPVATDLGRVARQADDGSMWACVGYAPAVWRRSDFDESSVFAVPGSLTARPLKDWIQDANDTRNGGVIFDVSFKAPGIFSSFVGARGEVVNFTRAGTATLLRGGVETVAAANQGRVDEDGLLIEPATTNLLSSPGDMTNATYWTPSQAVVTGGQLAPDGTLTAIKLTDNSVNAGHYVYQLGTSAVPTAISIYAKAGTKSWLRLMDNAGAHFGYVDLSNGAVGSVSASTRVEVESVGGGWWRISVMATPAAGMLLAAVMTTANSVGSYLGDGTGTIYLWRPQTEAQLYATSWTATTRAAETVTIPFPTLGAEWAIEVDVVPLGAQRWDRDVRMTLFGIGQQNTPNSIEGYVNAGAFVGLVTDAASGVKTETTGALAAASNYLGQRRLTVASDGFGRPAAFIDGRQSVNAPAGAGTGIFIGTGAGQSVVYLGAVNTGAAAGSYGGFKIRQIRMSDSRRCPTRPLGAYSYAWAMPRGYVPPSNVYAFLGDSITQGIYSVAITEPFPAGAAANKGATYFGHNFGIGANSSDMILRRWRLDVRERKYSTMVLLAGINDVNGIIGSATTIANLDAIITEALSDGMTVIVLTLLPGGKTAGDPLRVNLDAINTWIRARAGITVLDAYALFDDGAGKMKVAWDIDGGSLHPNQTGQTQLAGLVSPALP